MGRAPPLTLDELRSDFERLLIGPLALAVSGGPDSMALMHLVAAWIAEPGTAQRQGMGPVPLIVLTVDHKLRPQSAEEAAWVKGEATRLGLPHETLAWEGPKPSSAVQAAARAARYGLIDDFLERELREGRVPAKRRIAVAHHEDDQAETVLMRLARGSGLDGLSGMRDEEHMPSAGGSGGCTIVRPLLRTSKARLMATLDAAGRSWKDDPSNRASGFERVRVRQALETLRGLGIGSAEIGRSAWRLSRARRAVLAGAEAAAFRTVKLHRGLFAEIDAAHLAELPDEYAVRILAHLLRMFGGSAPPARLSQIEQLAARIIAPAGTAADQSRAETLGGCRIVRDDAGRMRIWREWGRDGLPTLELQPGAQKIWDQRFSVALGAGETETVEVRAFGPDDIAWLREAGGLAELERLRAPSDAIFTLPSFWRNGRLVAVPYFPALAGAPDRFCVRFLADDGRWASA
ncbi:MAG: tRNA lysidine(34) synthetase TilS [Hyphomicrobiaceae bacterium]